MKRQDSWTKKIDKTKKRSKNYTQMRQSSSVHVKKRMSLS